MRRPIPLLPPVTPAVPGGLQRGGVFQHAATPDTFADVAPRTIPTNSPIAHEVSQNVLRTPVSFAPSMQVRQVTGFGAYGASPDLPPMPIRPAAPLATPHGGQEGGIFGSGVVYAAIQGQPVRQIRTMRKRLAGFGASPDGIGCGCGGLGGCGCMGSCGR